MALAIITSIWEGIFQEIYGIDYTPASVEFFDGHIATIPNLRGGKSVIASPIFHLGSNNTIYISREVLETIDFHTTENSAIGLTLTLAHEVGHSIQRQLPVQMTKAQKEDMADFVAGYTMQILEQMGLLGEDDIETALLYFASIGTSPGDRVGERVHDTPEGRKSHLMRGYASDIEGVRQEFDQYNPISLVHQRFIEILDSLGTGTIILEKNIQSYNIH